MCSPALRMTGYLDLLGPGAPAVKKRLGPPEALLDGSEGALHSLPAEPATTLPVSGSESLCALKGSESHFVSAADHGFASVSSNSQPLKKSAHCLEATKKMMD